MTQNKVYEISPDLGLALYFTALDKRDTLGKAIDTLAKSLNESVFFHNNREPVGGAPVVLLECSEAFLELVKKLPEFHSVRECKTGTTVRSASVQAHYTNQASPKKQIPPQP